MRNDACKMRQKPGKKFFSQNGNCVIYAVRIIARRPLRDFSIKHPGSKIAVESWYAEAIKADWKSPSDIKRKYRSASFLQNNRVVFNIGGNKYRLIVKIRYDLGIVFVRFIGTHAEYDRIDAENV